MTCLTCESRLCEVQINRTTISAEMVCESCGMTEPVGKQLAHFKQRKLKPDEQAELDRVDLLILNAQYQWGDNYASKLISEQLEKNK